MLDSMFRIVQNSRSFVTHVTLTAAAPTAVAL